MAFRRNPSVLPGWETLKEPEQTPSVDAGSDDESVDQIAPSVASSQSTAKRRAWSPPTPSTRPAKRARIPVPQARTYASPVKPLSQKTVDRQNLPSQSARPTVSRAPPSAGRADARRVSSGGSRASNMEGPSTPALAFPKRTQRTAWRGEVPTPSETPNKRATSIINISSASDEEPSLAGQKKRFRRISGRIVPNSHATPRNGHNTPSAPPRPEEVIVISSDSDDDGPSSAALASSRFNNLMSNSKSKSNSHSKSHSKSRSPVVSRKAPGRPTRSPTAGRVARAPARPVNIEPIVIPSSSPEQSPEPAYNGDDMPPPDFAPAQISPVQREFSPLQEHLSQPVTTPIQPRRPTVLTEMRQAPGSSSPDEARGERSSSTDERNSPREKSLARASAPRSTQKRPQRVASNDSDLFPLGDDDTPPSPTADIQPFDDPMETEAPVYDSANADAMQSVAEDNMRPPSPEPTIPKDISPRSHSHSPAEEPPTSSSSQPTSQSPSRSPTQSFPAERARNLKRVRGALYGGTTGFFKDVFRARTRSLNSSTGTPASASSSNSSSNMQSVTSSASRGPRGPAGTLAGGARPISPIALRIPERAAAGAAGTAPPNAEDKVLGPDQGAIDVGAHAIVPTVNGGSGGADTVRAGALHLNQGTEHTGADPLASASAPAQGEAVSKRRGSPMEVDSAVPDHENMIHGDGGEPASPQGVDKPGVPGLEAQVEEERGHGARAGEDVVGQLPGGPAVGLPAVQAPDVHEAVPGGEALHSPAPALAPASVQSSGPRTPTREGPTLAARRLTTPHSTLSASDSLSAVINSPYHTKKRPEVIDLTLSDDEDDDAGVPATPVSAAQGRVGKSTAVGAAETETELAPASAKTEPGLPSAPLPESLGAPFRDLSRLENHKRPTKLNNLLERMKTFRRPSMGQAGVPAQAGAALPISAASAVATAADAGKSPSAPSVDGATAPVRDAHVGEPTSPVGVQDIRIDEPEPEPRSPGIVEQPFEQPDVHMNERSSSHNLPDEDAPAPVAQSVAAASTSTDDARGSAESRVVAVKTRVTSVETPPAESADDEIVVNTTIDALSENGVPTREERSAVTDDELECLGMLEYPESLPSGSEADYSDVRSIAMRRKRRKNKSRQSSASSGSLSLVPRRSNRQRSAASMASSSHSVDPIDLLSDPVEPSTPDSEPATHVSSLSRAQNFSTHNFEDLIIDGIPIIALTPARLMAEFPPQVYYAKDLPHLLQDHMNALAPAFRRTEMARTVFEAVIRDNTSADEPDAPPIRVVNDFDDEPTPPWEFHYSNHMWHARGVPPPDLQNLRGCGCEGVCDPRSKTCSCMIRQQKYLEETAIQGCIYDDRGRLKVHDYPIFECNDLCGCLDECKNRVVQHGRKCEIDIRKTEKKGWGVFARKKIPAGTFVGIYAGELILDEDGDERGQKYNKFGRTYLFTLDFYYLKDTVEDRDEWEPKYVVDAYHAGNFTRFLNHSCDPNCTINPCYINEANIDKPLLTIFAYRDIEASEELCFSYHGPPDEYGVHDRNAITSAASNDAIYVKCCCGSWNCVGILFS